jgi:hypothetical protein
MAVLAARNHASAVATAAAARESRPGEGAATESDGVARATPNPLLRAPSAGRRRPGTASSGRSRKTMAGLFM